MNFRSTSRKRNPAAAALCFCIGPPTCAGQTTSCRTPQAIAKQHCWQWGTNLRAWLFTIMHNQNVNGVRRRMREGTAIEFDDEWPFPIGPTDSTGRFHCAISFAPSRELPSSSAS
jgi:hypothetical protein